MQKPITPADFGNPNDIHDTMEVPMENRDYKEPVYDEQKEEDE